MERDLEQWFLGGSTPKVPLRLAFSGLTILALTLLLLAAAAIGVILLVKLAL